jgi:hypothetical protein
MGVPSGQKGSAVMTPDWAGWTGAGVEPGVVSGDGGVGEAVWGPIPSYASQPVI